MNRRKKRVSLIEFLKTGKLGSLTPSRLFSPENLFELFGEPDEVEVFPIDGEDSSNLPVVVSYGTIEFHFDSSSTMLCIHHDNPFLKYPIGGKNIKFDEFALLKYKRTKKEFLALSESNGLLINIIQEHSDGFIAKTSGGVEIGFEFDEPGTEATLRWFSLDLKTIANNA